MKSVFARPSNNRYLSAGSTTKFWRVRGSLNAEFLHRVHRDQTICPALDVKTTGSPRCPIQIAKIGRHADVATRAVDHPIVRTCSLAVDAELTRVHTVTYS